MGSASCLLASRCSCAVKASCCGEFSRRLSYDCAADRQLWCSQQTIAVDRRVCFTPKNLEGLTPGEKKLLVFPRKCDFLCENKS
jgi:hypothetical protein